MKELIFLSCLFLAGCSQQGTQNFARSLQLMNQELQAKQQAQQFNAPPCVFNPATNAYHQCFHFAAGQCAHYGVWCQP